MKDFEEEFIDYYEILNVLNEIKRTIKENRYINDSNKDLKKDYPDKIEKLEEKLLDYMGENDLKTLKT